MREKLITEPYRDIQVWRDLAEAIDTVWADRIDNVQKIFPLLRDILPYTFSNYGEEESYGVFDKDDFYPFLKEEYMACCKMLGFNFSDSFFTREDFQMISSNYASYLADKGTEQFTNFIGYCLGSVFDCTPLWTEDYSAFLPEGDAGIGTELTQGGTWYPTTHVLLTYDFIKFGLFTPYNVRNFFYYIAPLNIVLGQIVYKSIVPVEALKTFVHARMTVTYV